LVMQELRSAAGLWAQCGFALELASPASLQVVDPPAGQLLTVGCGLGQAASGGSVTLRSAGRTVKRVTRAGERPASVAARLAEALGGQRAPAVFENQRAAGDAFPTADLSLNGAAKWERAGAVPISSDPTLPVCLGQVDL